MITLLAFTSFLAVAPIATSSEPLHVVLEAQHRTEIAAQVTSTVIQIGRRMGETFQEGDVLIRLDDRIYVANVSKAAAKVDEARAKYTVAQRLLADKVVSPAELLAGKAALAQAEADYAMADKSLEDCIIRAPYNGKVQQVFVELYERVEPGMKLIEILDESALLARFFIDANLIPSQMRAEDLKFVIHNGGGTRTPMNVRVAPGIDPASSLLRVEAEIDNADGSLRPGMTGTLILQSEEKSHA